jgi:diguanylate cyclase (GGDEF)-like protein
VLSRTTRNRLLPRVAAGFLTIGLFALAALALWSLAATAGTAASVRQMNAVSGSWALVSQDVSMEYEALVDYLRAEDDVGRQPLISSIGSAEPILTWLEHHGPGGDSRSLRTLRATYTTYTSTLRALVAAEGHGDEASVDLYAMQAELTASSLRRQTTASGSHERLVLNRYLTRVEAGNVKLRVAASIVAGADLVLALVCTYILLAYQRKTERQADDSRHRATHDGLTGIPNRVLFNDRLDEALRQADRQDTSVGLLLLDLNRFKEINDTLGHHQGDLLLEAVADRLSGSVRAVDTVARLGGDEFGVLMPGVASTADAAVLAQRLLAQLQRPAALHGVVVDVRASIGVAVYPAQGTTSSELMQHADVAMYVAKRGHLGTALYDPESDNHTTERLGLLVEFREALDKDELVLHYQPKVDASGDVVGVEALVRWRHPRRGLLPPADFIPMVEDSDLIQPMTDHVLRAALTHQRQWREDGVVLPVAVNVATRCLADSDLPDRTFALLAAFGTAPDQLMLEITESALISDPDRVIDVLSRLRAGGVRISIDDFGTGYASLAYLQTLPLDEVKIDRRFVADLADHRSGAIVHAIAELGLAFGLDIVAEGIEDENTRLAVIAAGCNVAQGYHICRPIPEPQLRGWLGARRIGATRQPAMAADD